MGSRLAALGRRQPWTVALLVYVVVIVILLWPSIRPGRTLMPADILGGVPPYGEVIPQPPQVHNGIPSDAPLQFHPFVVFLADELHEGRLPQWNPLILGGVPMSPNGFVPTNYPPVLLLRWLAPFDGYNFLVVFHLVIAAIGGYAFSRRLRADFTIALLAGFGVLLGGIWLHWSLHLVHLIGMVWLPLAMAAVHRAARQPSVSSGIAVAVPFGAWWLGGNPQYCYFGTIALGALGAGLVLQQLRAREHVVASVACLGLGLLAGAALAAPTLLPTVALADDVARAREPVGSMADTHLKRSELVELVVPEIGGSPVGGTVYRPDLYGGPQMDTPYVGVSILVLAFAALPARRARTRLLLVAVAVGCNVLAFTGWPHHLLYEHLPGYDRFRASSRWLAVVPAVAAPLAAIGMTAVLRNRRSARVVVIAGAALAMVTVTVLAVQVARDPDPIAPQRFLASRLVLAAAPALLCAAGAIVVTRWRQATVALFGAAILLEVVAQVPRWYPSVTERTAFPELTVTRLARAEGGRLIRVGPQSTGPSLVSNLPMAYGLSDAQGLAVLFPKAADRYLRTIEDYGNFAIAVNAPAPLSTPALTTSPMLDALDVRTVLVDGEHLAPTGLTLVHQGPPAIYRRSSPGAAVLVRDASPATEDEMWAAIAEPTWDPSASSAVEGLASPVAGDGGTVRALGDGPDDERWSVSSPSGGFLRLSGAYHDGWSATVDGDATRVYRADGLFRGVVVPPGDHTVRLRFRNASEVTGRRIAVAAAVLLTLAAAITAWRRRSVGGADRPPGEHEELLAEDAPRQREPEVEAGQRR